MNPEEVALVLLGDPDGRVRIYGPHHVQPGPFGAEAVAKGMAERYGPEGFEVRVLNLSTAWAAGEVVR